MEAEWFAERAALRCLARQHPDWTQAELAATLGRSRTWVAKWLARLNAAAPDDQTVLHARSCARHTPSPAPSQALVARILALRDEPPTTCAACRARAPCSITSPKIKKPWRWGYTCPVPLAPSGKCCGRMDGSPAICLDVVNR